MSRRLGPLALLCLTLLLPLTGCWSRQELGQVDLALGLGIDRAPQGYRISAQVVIAPQASGGVSATGAGGGGGGGGITVTVAQTEANPSAALHDLRTQLPKRPVYSHVEVAVVGEALARQGLAPALDFVSRTVRVRDDAWLVVARGTAEQLLRARPPGNALSARGLRRTLEQAVAQSLAPRTGSVIQFVATLADVGVDPVLPIVRVGSAGQLEVEGLAVFRSDRLVGELGRDATYGYNYVRGNASTGVLAFGCTSQPGDAGSLLSVTRQRSRVRPVWGARTRLRISVQMHGILDDRSCLRPTTGIAQAPAQTLARAALRRRIQAALTTATRLRADIFGLAREIWRYRPALGRGLITPDRGYLARLPVEVVTAVTFDNSGELAEPIPGGAWP